MSKKPRSAWKWEKNRKGRLVNQTQWTDRRISCFWINELEYFIASDILKLQIKIQCALKEFKANCGNYTAEREDCLQK